MPKKKQQSTGEPKFPYTTEPKSLQRLLSEIPKRPKPPKVGMETLKGWGVSNNNNAMTAVRVLKKIGLLSSSGEPLDAYVEFMKTGSGPALLAQRMRQTYRVLFENSLAPQSESDDELKKLFNIHSGGGADVMRLQVQTFKILAEFADFGAAGSGDDGSKGISSGNGSQLQTGTGTGVALPPIQVDLHIHLPENKTSRDYETIIQDIARYIYGREIGKI